MSKAKPTAVLRREFGLWLQKKRKSSGMSQRFVAAKSGLTVTQLSRIENGRSGTRRDTIILLAGIIGIDETEALGKYAPESVSRFPEELENIPFEEFDKDELQEIAGFINFKLSQKRKDASVKTEEKPSELTRKTSKKAENKTDAEPGFEILPEENWREVPTYRLEDGELISDAETEKNGHTTQKPSDN